MTINPAVTAAAEALCWPAHPGYKPGGCEPCRERAYIAVSAARPIIEAEVRERIATEIETNCRHMNHENRRLCSRCVTAARIARGGK